jgi:YD repeat-containing protein
VPWLAVGTVCSDYQCIYSGTTVRDVEGHHIWGVGNKAGSSSNFAFTRREPVSCPSGYATQTRLLRGSTELIKCKPPTPCAADQKLSPAGVCQTDVPIQAVSNPQCNGVGDPIFPLTGAMKETISTGFALRGADLIFTYDTTRQLSGLLYGDLPSLGSLWSSSLHRRLTVGSGALTITAYRGNGSVVTFALRNGVYVPDANVADRVVSFAGGYYYTDSQRNQLEKYNAIGQLVNIGGSDGSSLSFSYSAAESATAPAEGYLLQVTDDSGRFLRFEYLLPPGSDSVTATRGLISKVTNSNGQSIVLGYSPSFKLTSVTWADGKSLQFLYENAALPWAMTGAIDENGGRFSTWSYDSQGRAVARASALGSNAYSVSYTEAPKYFLTETVDSPFNLNYQRYQSSSPIGVSVVGPNNQSFSVTSSSVLGSPVPTGTSQPAGSGCAASNSASTYDAIGNLLSRDNFQGERTCYAYSPTRNVETSRVEGLSNTVACNTVISEQASLPAGARRVITKWHPDWKLPTKILTPGKLLTKVYNGQADPLNSNLVASCAPGATLPNSSPVPLLCREAEQEASSSILASATDPTFSSVLVLLHGDGSDSSTTFIDDSPNPHQLSIVSGAPQIKTSQSKYGGASINFPGSSAITFSDAVSSSFWTSDWTVEFWALPGVATQNPAAIFGNRWPDGGAQLYLSYSAGSLTNITYEIREYGSLTGFGVGTSTPGFTSALAPVGAFNHIAVTKVGTTYGFFLNGFKLPAIVRAVQPANTAHNLNIGSANPAWYGYEFNGFIDDFRITMGAPRYADDFKPDTLKDGNLTLPASVLTKTSTFSYDSAGRLLSVVDPNNRTSRNSYFADTPQTTSLLLHGDGVDGSTSILDSSLSSKIVTPAGGAKISTLQSKFGGASMFFDGVRSYLSVASSPSLSMQSSDFTIEMWIHKLGNNANTSRLWNPDGDIYGDVYLGIDASGNLVCYGSLTGSNWDAWSFASGIAIPNGVWKHVALVRASGTVTLYVDGVGTVLTSALGSTALYDGAPSHVIGSQSTGVDRAFSGYIDEVRISKGVARYTSPFTPPVAAFPNPVPGVHSPGDLQSSTNAAGHVTQILSHDLLGRVLRFSDPKGVVTDMAYTPRGWLSSVTVTPPGGVARTTGYSYDAVGQMIQASLADGTSLGYTYDAAHRLVGVLDAKGNSVTYTLDAVGNRVGEQVKDPLGNLQRNITRVYDALNRVQQITGASQ